MFAWLSRSKRDRRVETKIHPTAIANKLEDLPSPPPLPNASDKVNERIMELEEKRLQIEQERLQMDSIRRELENERIKLERDKASREERNVINDQARLELERERLKLEHDKAVREEKRAADEQARLELERERLKLETEKTACAERRAKDEQDRLQLEKERLRLENEKVLKMEHLEQVTKEERNTLNAMRLEIEKEKLRLDLERKDFEAQIAKEKAAKEANPAIIESIKPAIVELQHTDGISSSVKEKEPASVQAPEEPAAQSKSEHSPPIEFSYAVKPNIFCSYFVPKKENKRRDSDDYSYSSFSYRNMLKCLAEIGLDTLNHITDCSNDEASAGHRQKCVKGLSVGVVLIDRDFVNDSNCQAQWAFLKHDLGVPIIPIIANQSSRYLLNETVIGYDIACMISLDSGSARKSDPLSQKLYNLIQAFLPMATPNTPLQNSADKIAAILRRDDDLSSLKTLIGNINEESRIEAVFEDDSMLKMNALCIAALFSRSQCLEYLVEIGLESSAKFVSAFTKKYKNITPIHLCCAKGYSKILDSVFKKLLANDIAKMLKTANSNKRKCLHLAAAGNHTELVALLLTNDAPIDDIDSYGQSPLVASVVTSAINTAKLLLDKGAAVNPKASNYDDDGNDTDDAVPIVTASKLKNSEMVALLLTHGANPNVIDASRMSPLYWVIQNKDMTTFDLLLSHPSIDCNYRKGQRQPLQRAAESGNLEMVTKLLEKGASTEFIDDEKSPLIGAARNGHTQVMNLLLKLIPEVSNTHSMALQEAAKEGHLEIVQELAAIPGVDINYCESRWEMAGMSAVFLATKYGHENIVFFLKSKGAKTTSDTGDLLQYSVEGGLANVVKDILAEKPVLISKIINKDGIEEDRKPHLLSTAAKGRQLDMFKLLLELGCRAGLEQALIDACGRRRGYSRGEEEQADDTIEYVRLLIKHGVDVNANDGSALERAIENEKFDIVSELVHAGANLAQEGILESALRHGKTDLMEIVMAKDPTKFDAAKFTKFLQAFVKSIGKSKAEGGQIKTIKLFLQYGGDPFQLILGARDTALHIACEDGQFEIVELFLAAKPTVSLKEVKNDWGETVLHCLCKNLDECENINALLAIIDRLFAIEGGRAMMNEYSEKEKLPIDKLMDLGRTPDKRAFENQLKMFKKLTEHGFDVTTQKSRTLHSAIASGNVKIVEFILSEVEQKSAGSLIGTFLRQRDDDLNNALHIAAHNSQLECLKLLLSDKYLGYFNINEKNSEGSTALTLVQHQGRRRSDGEHSVGCVELLLSKGADPAVGDNENFTFVHAIAGSRNSDFAPIAAKIFSKKEYLLLRTNKLSCNKGGGLTPLHYALSNSSEMIETLIKAGADINALDYNLKTPLHHALGGYRPMETVIERMIEAGALLDARDKSGKTALWLAAAGERTDSLVTLLCEEYKKKGISLDDAATEAPFYSPLFIAVAEGNRESAKILLKHGANKNYVTPEGTTFAHVVCASGTSSLLELCSDEELLAENSSQETPFVTALKKGSDQIVLALIEKFTLERLIAASKSCSVRQILEFCLSFRELDVFFKILEAMKYDINTPDENGKTLLMFMAGSGRRRVRDAWKDMVDKGAKIEIVDKNGDNAWFYLVKSKASGIEDVTQSNFGDPSDHARGLHALFDHIDAESYDIESYLDKYPGTNLNALDENGFGILHKVCKKYHGATKLVEKLLERGADRHQTTKQGELPIHFGRYLQILISESFEGDLTKLTNDGSTILHNIEGKKSIKHLFENHLSVVQTLLHVKNAAGRQPIHGVEDVETFQLLKDHGADVNAQDNEGKTLLHLSVGHHKEFFNTLLSQVDVFAVDKLGRNVLHHLALQKTRRHGESYATQIFFKYRVPANQTDVEGNTPAMLALKTDEGRSEFSNLLMRLEHESFDR